jgi:hypothetical protein
MCLQWDYAKIEVGQDSRVAEVDANTGLLYGMKVLKFLHWSEEIRDVGRENGILYGTVTKTPFGLTMCCHKCEKLFLIIEL